MNELISENGVSRAAPDFAWVSYLDKELCVLSSEHFQFEDI